MACPAGGRAIWPSGRRLAAELVHQPFLGVVDQGELGNEGVVQGLLGAVGGGVLPGGGGVGSGCVSLRKRNW